mmetsp:Transcript_27540/g.27411  ORF Transcript_27540/g.27411 Transcript_27540/m.27411 type:complete len:143 (-) Transcript_27540:8-436(-)
MEISFLMDRTTTNVAKAQDGFIKNLIKPAFLILEKVLPHLSQNLKYMDENIDKWAKKVVQYSVNTHSHMETRKSKLHKEEDEKSDISEDSFMPNEFSPGLESKLYSEKGIGVSCIVEQNYSFLKSQECSLQYIPSSQVIFSA